MIFHWYELTGENDWALSNRLISPNMVIDDFLFFEEKRDSSFPVEILFVCYFPG